MKPSISWCRGCLTSHPPGEHTRRAAAPKPAQPAAPAPNPAPAKPAVRKVAKASAPKKPAKPARKLNPAAPAAPKKKAKPKKPAAKAVPKIDVATLPPAERDALAAAELHRRACDAARARRFRKRQRLAEARA